MNDIIYLGYTTMTHGLKGHLKFYSQFERKDILLKGNVNVIIDGVKHVITKASIDKNHYLIIIDGLNDINLVEEYRNKDIYLERKELKLGDNEYLYQDLIGFDIIDNEENLGKVKNISYNNSVLLYIEHDKNYYLPLIDEYIVKVDLLEKKIIVRNAKELII